MNAVVSVANIAFDNVTMDEAIERIVAFACSGNGDPRHVCTGNLDHLVLLQNDGEFRRAYESAALVLADGMPVVWLSRLGRAGALRERVAGSDLFWELARESHATGLRLFFLGGAPGAAEGAARAVQSRYPRAQVCGAYCPPASVFDTEEEQARIAAAVRRSAPDVLLVGLGAPKQEKWIAAHKHLLGVPVSIGVGGTFEMAAGMVSRAPRWMQHIGLEWSWRLALEPGRLYRRYLARDLPFLLGLTLCTLAARGAAGAVGPVSEPCTTYAAAPSAAPPTLESGR